MSTKNKAGLVFICIMAIMLCITLYLSHKLDFSLKDIFAKTEIKSTKPYALKFTKTNRIKNITGSVDYYVSIKDNVAGRHVSCIYSFDISTGSDFTNDEIRQYQDSILFPYPTVTVDQNDIDPVLVVDEKGEFKWNDELQPLKRAMEMMATDYGRRYLTAESSVSLKDYFEQIDSLHRVGFYQNHLHTPLDISSELLPFDIRLFPDLLDHNLTPVCQDSIFTRQSVQFYDGDEQVISISYLGPWKLSFDDTKDYFEETFTYSVRFIDPFNPKEKCIYVAKDLQCAYIILDGVKFIVDYKDDNYFSDMLYIMSTIYNTGDKQFSTRYQYWIEEYDDLIHKINKGQFKEAKLNLGRMEDLQQKYHLSWDELYFEGLLNVLNGAKSTRQTGYEYFDRIVAGYADIANNSAKGILKDEEEREALINTIRYLGNSEEVVENIERYLVSHKSKSNCTAQEIQQYISNLSQKGGLLDGNIISSMEADSFLDYVNSVMYNSLRSLNQYDFENKTIEDCFKSQPLSGHDNIVIVKDCRDFDESFYGDTDEQILQSIGIRSDLEDPVFIILYPEDRGTFRAWDKDAVIFYKDYLHHVPNYSGMTGNPSSATYYKDLEIGRNVIRVNTRDKFNIKEPYIIQMCSSLKKSYLADSNSYGKDLKRSMGQYLVWIVNSYIKPAPYYYKYYEYIDKSVIPEK